MNVAFLIQFLQTLPKESELQIAYWDQDYDNRRVVGINSIEFHTEIKERNGTNCLLPTVPARIIFS